MSLEFDLVGALSKTSRCPSIDSELLVLYDTSMGGDLGPTVMGPDTVSRGKARLRESTRPLELSTWPPEEAEDLVLRNLDISFDAISDVLETAFIRSSLSSMSRSLEAVERDNAQAGRFKVGTLLSQVAGLPFHVCVIGHNEKLTIPPSAAF